MPHYLCHWIVNVKWQSKTKHCNSSNFIQCTCHVLSTLSIEQIQCSITNQTKLKCTEEKRLGGCHNVSMGLKIISIISMKIYEIKIRNIKKIVFVTNISAGELPNTRYLSHHNIIILVHQKLINKFTF